MAGFIALSDPPREDSAALIAELAGLGVRTIMVTGDAPVTAKVVAGVIGISGPVWATTPLPEIFRRMISPSSPASFRRTNISSSKRCRRQRPYRRHVRRRRQRCAGVAAGADGHRSLHGDGCCQIGRRHRANRARPRRHRRLHQGRAHDLSANPDLYVEVDRPQGRPGALPGRRPDHHRPGHPDADAHGPHDGHRRLPGHVVVDRQRSAVADAQRLEDRPFDRGRHHHGGVRSAVLRRCFSTGRFVLNLDIGALADAGRGDAGVQRPGRLLRRARAATSLEFAARQMARLFPPRWI